MKRWVNKQAIKICLFILVCEYSVRIILNSWVFKINSSNCGCVFVNNKPNDVPSGVTTYPLTPNSGAVEVPESGLGSISKLMQHIHVVQVQSGLVRK